MVLRGNSDALRLWPFASERRKDAVEDAEPAPADEASYGGHALLERPSTAIRCGSHRQYRRQSAGHRPAARRETTENKEKSAPSDARSAKTGESSKSPSMETWNHPSVNRS